MNLQITGKNAIVCASSRGLGKGCAISLAREGANVIINGLNAETLEQALAEVRAQAAGEVAAVRCDVTCAEGRAKLLAACPAPDILINNAGGPPPGDFREWDETQWNAAVNANMLTPIALIKATLDGMIERGFGRIVNITSAAVKSPIPVLGLSNGARAGLTGFIAGLARQPKRGVTINNLLPGAHVTDRMRANYRYQAEQKKVDFETLYQQAMQANPTGRFGDAQEFGDLCAYLCSAQAGFINGQNIMVDGGAFPGTL